MSLMHSILMGAVAGMRAMTPLAALVNAARSGTLPAGVSPRLSQSRLAPVTMWALAGGELLGDKLDQAPDRTDPAGLAARVASGMIAGAALAPRSQRGLGALLGASAAFGATYLAFNLRKRASNRYRQTLIGVVEDALAVASAAMISHTAARAGRR